MGERLTCGGFSLGKPIHLGNFQFIANYFDGLSFSPRGGILRPRRHGLNTPQGINPTMGHDRGLHRGVPHNHTMNGERSSRSSHDDGSPAGWWHHGRQSASLSSNVMLITEGSRRKLALGSPSRS